MNVPELQHNAGIYLLHWRDLSITARLDHLAEDRHGTTAEITLKTTLPGIPPHLHQARFNLLSTASRKTLAKHLGTRIELDWDALIEQASVLVLQQHRQGEPVIQLGTLPPRESLRYRIEPLLLEGHPNLLYGDGGTGKTLFCCFLCCLLDGIPEACGLRVEPGKVLYLDYEADADEFQSRFQAVQRGLGVDNMPEIMYRFCARRLVDEIEEIQRICLEHTIQVVIVDPMGPACGGDADKSGDIIAYFTALRSLRLTTLTVDHQNKEGRLYGNVYKYNQARNIWRLRKVQEDDAQGITIGLYHEKSNYGKRHRPLGFEVKFDGAVTFLAKTVGDVPELAEHLLPWEQIRHLLKHGAMRVGDIAEELKLAQPAVSNELRRHACFIKLSEGSWGLKEQNIT